MTDIRARVALVVATLVGVGLVVSVLWLGIGFLLDDSEPTWFAILVLAMAPMTVSIARLLAVAGGAGEQGEKRFIRAELSPASNRGQALFFAGICLSAGA